MAGASKQFDTHAIPDAVQGHKPAADSGNGQTTVDPNVHPASAVHRAVSSTTVTQDEAPPRKAASRARLLVVDDEPQIGNTLRLLLQPDCEVSPMTSARAAVSRIERGDRFDIIFCDLMMPDMSGMQFHASLMEIAPDQANAVVFMTGGVYLESSREFLSRISNRCIDKPFDLPQLRALIASRIH